MKLIHKKLIILLFPLWILFSTPFSSGAEDLKSFLPRDLPDGWALVDGPHLFTKKTLFQRINGQAGLFFKYGFLSSVYTLYQNQIKRERQIELDIYDMGNTLQAFGIFSRFRNEDQPIGIGLDSYLDDNSVFFYQGKYFIMFYATKPDPVILKQLGMGISSRISSHTRPPKEIGYFPQNGLKPGSIQYFSEGLLGHQFLKRGFQGTYIGEKKAEVEVKIKDKVKAEAEVKIKDEVKAKVEDQVEDRGKLEEREVSLFLAIFENSRDALNALKIYKDYLSKKGKIESGMSTFLGFQALKGEAPYKGQVIVVQRGVYLLGGIGFEKGEDGENRLKEFIKNVN